MGILNKIKKLSEDTFFRGAVSGVVAGIIKDIVDFIFYLTNVKGLFFWSFASVDAYGKLPKGVLMNLVGLSLEIIFCGFLGVIFALLAQQIKTRHYLLTGVFYGSMVWFFIRGVIVVYNIDQLKIPGTPYRPLITWALSMLFGILLAWMDRRLSPKTS